MANIGVLVFLCILCTAVVYPSAGQFLSPGQATTGSDHDFGFYSGMSVAQFGLGDAGFLGVNPKQHIRCRSDIDCPGSTRCINGQCTTYC